MEQGQDTSPSPKPIISRSSLACLPCRSRHQKCDGKKPQCTRCIAASKQCHYAKSRRGGLDRAALAERRRRLAADEESHEQSRRQDGSATDDAVVLSSSVSDSSAQSHHRPGEDTGSLTSFLLDNLDRSGVLPAGDFLRNSDLLSADGIGGVGVSDSSPSSRSTPSFRITDPDKIQHDPLITSYYANFHSFHPFVLPRKHLIRRYDESSSHIRLRPVVAVLRLIGYLYDAKDWSLPLREFVDTCLSEANPHDPFTVQSRLLYSIALFWYDRKDAGLAQAKGASQVAIELEMFLQPFATNHGEGDAVLTECWRRTWWTTYILHAYYAGTLGTMNYELIDVEPTTELPCEESQYESGNIPEPQTLQDFDCREFDSSNTTFSSFAYLIGAVRCGVASVSSAPKVPEHSASPDIVQASDAMVDGWLLLLPKEGKPVMTKSGKIDELMFQAHMLIHVSTIGLHRPYSDLKFNVTEEISSCAREPPIDLLNGDLVNIHTVRVIRSVEAQIRLLALPSRPFKHSPFNTCMISEGTLALLSACTLMLRGKELTVARNQIRMTMGCLAALGEIWPRTKRNVGEIQTIARQVLRLPGSGKGKGTGSSTTSSGILSCSSRSPLLSDQIVDSALGVGPAAVSTGGEDVMAGLEALNGSCSWFNMDDMDPGIFMTGT